MTVLLSLVAAASYGLGDFWGGQVSKRAPAWSVALWVQVAGSLATFVLALIAGGSPSAGDFAWAVTAGLGNGFGTVFLYRGLASGRVGVVAPISGVGAALIPVLVGVGLGERPHALVWVGVALAFPAIWLVSRQPQDSVAMGSGVLDGVLAGLGFGILFVGLSQVQGDAGLLPLSLNQAVGGVVTVLVAVVLREPWVPRDPRAAAGALSGLLGATATGLFMVASRGGNLTIAAVVVSLYPAFTILLAAVFLRERVHPTQGVGLAMCAASVVLVAAG